MAENNDGRRRKHRQCSADHAGVLTACHQSQTKLSLLKALPGRASMALLQSGSRRAPESQFQLFPLPCFFCHKNPSSLPFLREAPCAMMKPSASSTPSSHVRQQASSKAKPKAGPVRSESPPSDEQEHHCHVLTAFPSLCRPSPSHPMPRQHPQPQSPDFCACTFWDEITGLQSHRMVSTTLLNDNSKCLRNSILHQSSLQGFMITPLFSQKLSKVKTVINPYCRLGAKRHQ